jgi:16S rRNA G966 N2-methylase RsmD
MARIQSLIKGGFYPTPKKVLDILTSWVRPKKRAGELDARYGAILDPFAGTGEALAYLAERWGLVPYAVELHAPRAEQATEAVKPLGGKAVCGAMELLHASKNSLRSTSSYGCSYYRNPEAFDVLYLNPPYHQGVECEYVLESLQWLRKSGVAIILIPEPAAMQAEFLGKLLQQLQSLKVFRFPDGEYDRFRQVVLIGRKRMTTCWHTEYETTSVLDSTILTMTADACSFEFAPGEQPDQFEIERPDIELLLAEVEKHGVTQSTAWTTLTAPTMHDLFFAPLEPVPAGWQMLLIGAGMLDGIEITNSRGHWLVKGQTIKSFHTDEDIEKTTLDYRCGDGRAVYNVTARQTHHEQVIIVVTALNLDTGEVEQYSSKDEDAYYAWLQENMAALVEQFNERYPPRFTEADLPQYLDLLNQGFHAPGVLPGRETDDPLPAQAFKMAALAHGLSTTEFSVLLRGEQGTGKTMMSLGVWYLLNARAFQEGKPVKAVCMCDAHLAGKSGKWEREARACLREFGIRVVLAKQPSDVFEWGEHDGPALLVLSRSKAKLGSGWQHAIQYKPRLIERREYTDDGYQTVKHLVWEPQCPQCGKILRDIEFERSQERCSCGAPLWESTRRQTKQQKNDPAGYVAARIAEQDAFWQMADLPEINRAWARQYRQRQQERRGMPADILDVAKSEIHSRRFDRLAAHNTGSASYPLARLAREKFGGSYFLVIDEAQAIQSGKSHQAFAAMDLIAGAQKVLAMTGTICGGYASHLYWLLWWANINRFNAQYGFGSEYQRRFTDLYGLHDYEERGTFRAEADTSGEFDFGDTWGYKAERGAKKKERPGAHPAMVALVAPATVSVELADLAHDLPPMIEPEPIIVPMEPALSRVYQNSIMGKYREHALAELREGDRGEFSRWFWAALGWPLCPGSTEPFTPALSAPAGGWAIDRQLVELVQAEVAESRNTLVYIGQVNKRDPRPRLLKVFEQAGVKAAALPDSVAPQKREKWLEEQYKDGVQVVILNPQRIETGLDLIRWPTLVYFGIPSFRLYTILQSKYRPMRLSQTRPVKISWITYDADLLVRAANLMAEKARAADLLNGQVSSGLAAFNAPATDIMRDLMRLAQRPEDQTIEMVA